MSLESELLQPLNSVSLEELSDNTVLLLLEPSKIMLADLKTRSVGVEMMKWKRKVKEAFGVEG